MKTPKARTKQESEDLIRRLDTMVAASDVTTFVDIQNYQTKHRLYMGKQYSRFMNQFEMFLCAMVEYSHTINYLDKKNWPINRGFQFVIATRALKQFHSAYELLNDGAYEDAITIARSVYESFLRIVFVSCHPECPYNAYPANDQKGAKFNATNFVKKELKLNWTTYSTSSIFAHSNMYIVMGDMIELSVDKKPKLITLTYEKDDDMISLVTNFMYFLCAAFLDIFDQLFTVDISNHKQKDLLQTLIDKLHENAQINHEALRSHNANEYWRKTAVDLENILELMKAMDSNPKTKWVNKWQEIRAK